MKNYDVIIIGAGGAGMMCAFEAGKRGRQVLLMDHAPKVGAKILISGGGRCNFTNMEIKPEAYVSENPYFCKSALSRFTPQDFIQLVRKHKIPFHEKKLGQLFCDGSARSIVDLLVMECIEARVDFQMNTKVESITKGETYFLIKTNQGDYQSASLVIATGGLSIPKIGATGFGYEIAQKFGLKIVPTAPALDGFVFEENLLCQLKGLEGVSLDTLVTCGGVSFRENILFTHKGLSGPAALQASLYWRPQEPIWINLIPQTPMEEWFQYKKKEESKMELKNLLLEFFPKSFSERFCSLYFSESLPLSQVPTKALREFCGQLHQWKIVPQETVGYQKAEVTRGGVSTEELSSKTMESKKVPGLFLIGEVIDVTGWLGGYNFQWAWSSGWAAGQYV